MNQLEVISAIAKKINVSYKDASLLLDTILECITEELIKGGKVKFVDFGVFEVVERAPRKGFNPRTREEIIIPACKEPTFKPGKELKETIKNIQ